MPPVLLMVALISAFYIAWGIGANDETMAAMSGSGFITLSQTVALGAALDFLGAALFGSRVERTIGEGIVSTRVGLSDAFVIVLAVAVWLTVSSAKGWPISTTHSSIGAGMGLGFYLNGLTGVNWKIIKNVAAGWFLSPALGFIGSFSLYILYSHLILERARGLRGRERVELASALVLAVSASLTAFSRGANDVGNASAFISFSVGRSRFVRLFCGVGMALGLLTLGRRVIRSVGLEIVDLFPGTAMIAQLSTATIMLAGTWLGLPISGSHVLVASFVGIALARRAPLNVKQLWAILFSWIATFPVMALMGYLGALLVRL